MKTLSQTALSILDLAPYHEQRSIAESFRASVRLAQHAEKWGYKRYWLAEHHSIEGISSAATPIVIGHIAEKTSKIRVGSGGIMLPNHAPILVAEQFGTLETLYPGRIDLGLGRAPGSDRMTMLAVRGDSRRPEDFEEMIAELEYFFAAPTPNQPVRAIPGAGLQVPLYILGSSLFSARLAAKLGRPYAFAGHFAPADMLEAFELYRREFRASAHLSKPYVMAGLPVIAADSDAHAEFLASSLYQTFLGMVRGARKLAAPPTEHMSRMWSTREEAAVRSMLSALIVGGPETVARGLQGFIDSSGADELIVSSNFYDDDDRLRSYEIVARVSGLLG